MRALLILAYALLAARVGGALPAAVGLPVAPDLFAVGLAFLTAAIRVREARSWPPTDGAAGPVPQAPAALVASGALILGLVRDAALGLPLGASALALVLAVVLARLCFRALAAGPVLQAAVAGAGYDLALRLAELAADGGGADDALRLLPRVALLGATTAGTASAAVLLWRAGCRWGGRAS